MNRIANVFKIDELPIEEELTSILAETSNVRIERIISTGQVSNWYDQEEVEYVILLEGDANIEYENSKVIALTKGDTLLIPAHIKHRVSYTSNSPSCIWICIFWKE